MMLAGKRNGRKRCPDYFRDMSISGHGLECAESLTRRRLRSAGIRPAVAQGVPPAYRPPRRNRSICPAVSLYARCFILTPRLGAGTIPVLADLATDSPTTWARNRAPASTTCGSLCRKLALEAHSRDDGRTLFTPARRRKRR